MFAVSNPDFIAGAIRPGLEVADVQKSLMVLAVTISTGTPFPLITSDFTHLLDGPGRLAENIVKTTAVFKNFQDDLIKLSEEIDERNKARVWTCNFFNPAKMETSISV